MFRTLPVLLASLLILALPPSCVVQALADEVQLPPEFMAPKASNGQTTHGILLLGYCSAIVLASIAGGWLTTIRELSHTTMQTVISFVGGLMLGIALFHLMPHSLHGRQTPDQVAWWMMAGILTMFLLIRCFHFHHHGPLEISTEKEDPCADHRGSPSTSLTSTLPIMVGHASCNGHDHDHDHDHGHDHDHDHGHDRPGHGHGTHQAGVAQGDQAADGIRPPHCHHAHQLSWVGITLGLSLHTLLDGMALAASVQADSSHRVALSLFGFGTFLAVLLHKPLDAVSISSLMIGGGWSARARFWVNVGFSAMCPLGALVFWFGIRQSGGFQHDLVNSALAFSAGIFLCISLSDLLPEMEFHAHNRVRLTAALVGGILLAYGITFLEPAHLH